MAEGFIQIRNGIKKHLDRGVLGLVDLAVYVQIHLQCDYSTGIWHGSAAKIAATTPRGADERAIRRSLEHLDEIGFIKRFNVQGKRGNYPVIINKYVPQSGAVMGKRLNAEATTDWRHPVYDSCREVSVTCPRGVRDVSGILKEEVKRREIKSSSPSESDGDATAGFDKFWASYPKKVGKMEARKAWVKMQCEGHLASIVSSLQAWKATSQWEESQYIPYPATWLNKSLFKEVPSPEAFRRFESREDIDRSQRIADAGVGKYRDTPAREQTPEEKAEIEETRINLERWEQLKNGMLPASPESIAWAHSWIRRLEGAHLPAQDSRLRLLRAFLLRASSATLNPVSTEVGEQHNGIPDSRI